MKNLRKQLCIFDVLFESLKEKRNNFSNCLIFEEILTKIMIKVINIT